MKYVFIMLFILATFFFSETYCEEDVESVSTPWWIYINPSDYMKKGKFDLTQVKNFTIEIPAQIVDDEFYFYSFMTVSNGAIVTKFRSGLKKDLEKRQRRIMYSILLNYFHESIKHFKERLDTPQRILPYEVNDFNSRWIDKHPGYIEKMLCGELTSGKVDGYINTNPFATLDEDVDKLNRNVGNNEN